VRDRFRQIGETLNIFQFLSGFQPRGWERGRPRYGGVLSIPFRIPVYE